MRVGYGLSRAQLIFERLAQRPEPPRAVADAGHPGAGAAAGTERRPAALRGEDRPPAVERSTPGVRTGNAPMRRSYRSSPLRGPTALAVGADRAVLAGEVATSVGGIVTDARVVVGADRFRPAPAR